MCRQLQLRLTAPRRGPLKPRQRCRAQRPAALDHFIDASSACKQSRLPMHCVRSCALLHNIALSAVHQCLPPTSGRRNWDRPLRAPGHTRRGRGRQAPLPAALDLAPLRPHLEYRVHRNIAMHRTLIHICCSNSLHHVRPPICRQPQLRSTALHCGLLMPRQRTPSVVASCSRSCAPLASSIHTHGAAPRRRESAPLSGQSKTPGDCVRQWRASRQRMVGP